MVDPSTWLPVIWAVLAAVAILIYVLLDGFDLGIGILFLGERDHDHRNTMVNTVAPVWDGNETWMIFGGAALYGVFPVAYGTILPALYLPIIIMLLALIMRGVGFEFRFKMKHSALLQNLWDWAFCLGSLVATFCQGVILGTLIQGIPVKDNVYVGGPLDWLTPFAMFCGFALIIGYALLGSTWLVWRTEGELHETFRKVSIPLAIAVFALIIGASVWTPFLHAAYMRKWTQWPEISLVLPVPVAVIGMGALLLRSLQRPSVHVLPFACAIAWFFLCFSGLGINIWPYIVPPSITIWQASSPPSSQAFVLVGAMFLLPTIMAYTIYSYYVFRGKVTAEQHYH